MGQVSSIVFTATVSALILWRDLHVFLNVSVPWLITHVLLHVLESQIVVLVIASISHPILDDLHPFLSSLERERERLMDYITVLGMFHVRQRC